MRRRTTTNSALAAFLVAFLAAFSVTLLTPESARANIDNFVLEGITAVGGVSLNDRIGKARDETTHVISIADCEAYLGHQIELSWSLSVPPLTGDLYSVKVSAPGGSCPTDDLDGGADDAGCQRVYDVRSDVTDSTHRVNVELDELTGGDCAAGTDQTATLYIVYEYSDNGDIQSQPIDFDVDLSAPSPPSNVQAIPGESSISITWDDDVNTEDGIKYRVYYRADGSLTSKELADGSSTSGTEASSETITGLESNTTYYFRVATIDPNDNEGELSTNTDVFTTTVPATDFWERYNDSGGGDPGGFCFIATAAYGTPMAAPVELLREFRDQVLMQTALGQEFVVTYYELSPPLAAIIAHNAWLAALVRILLFPLIFFAWFLLKLGWVGKVAVVLGFWLAGRLVRAALARRYRLPGPEMRPLAPLFARTAPPEEVHPC